MKWIELTPDNLPPIGAWVLLRRGPTQYANNIKYFAVYRTELRARDQRVLGWDWHPGNICRRHITHFAYINEPDHPSRESATDD